LDLLLIVLWAQPGELPGFQIDDELFHGWFSIAGAAILSALQEYETGQYVAVEFSQKNVGNVFDSILDIIDSVQHDNPTHYSHPAGFETPKLKMLILHNNTNFNRSK